MAVRRVTHTSYGRNVRNKFGGVLVGFLFFIASFVVLWISQGQVNYGRIAKTSAVVSPDSVDSSMDGEFVSVTAPMTTMETVGDPSFIRSGDYIAVERTAEMYAWDEVSESQSRSDGRGGTITETIYDYQMEWTEYPDDSSTFEQPQGHMNPTKKYESSVFSVSTAKVGAYNVFPTDMTLPSAEQTITPTSQNAILSGGRRIEGDYIFEGRGSLQSPQIGDMRMSFAAVPNNAQVTVFGEMNGGNIQTYTFNFRNKEGLTLYRAILGDRDTAIAVMKGEYKTLVLILVLIGFLLNWLGLAAMFGFIPALLRFIPFLAEASKFLIGLVMLPISIVLTLVTILISFVAHNPIALIIVVVALLAIIGILFATRKKGGEELPPEAPAE